MVAGIHQRLIAGGHGAAEPRRKISGFGCAARGQDKLVPALLRALHQIGGQIADAQNPDLLHFDLHGISSSTSAMARAVAAMSASVCTIEDKEWRVAEGFM